jgi:flagellar M-ring protein FliF
VSPRVDQALGRARGLFSGFTPGQRAIVVVAGLALVLGAVALTRWVSQPQWTPLFGNLSGSDANAVVEQLRTEGVEYRLTDGGSTVLVPQSVVYDLRVSLSGKGIPAGEAQSGYSLLDEQGITATDFQQNVAYRRALEGELGRTLMAIDSVESAVVHLAMPKKDVFASETDEPTASVLVDLRAGQELTREQVAAVTHLVAGSIEGLDAGRVTVSDSSGRMLSLPQDGSTEASLRAAEIDSQTAQFEERISSNVQQMLDRVLGTGRSYARVSADLNFDSTDSTSEQYSYPEDIPPVAESESAESYGAKAPAAGGALGQTWPTLTPSAGDAGNGYYLKQQRTRNNSVDKNVSRTRVAPGGVERLSVAVVMDSRSTAAVDPTQIQQLVSNAVGADPERGDSVQVQQIPFDTTASAQAQKELAEAAKAAKQSGYIDLGKQIALGLLVLVILVVALRRTRRRGGDRTTVEATAHDLPGTSDVLIPSQITPALEAVPGQAAVGAAQQAALEQEHLRSEIAKLVENQPDEVAQVIQSWLAERNA